MDLLVDRSGSSTAEALVNDTNELWKRCGDVLRDRMSDATWRTWFQGLVPQDFDGDLLVLSAPNTLVRERVESRYLDLIASAAREATAREVKVRLEVGPITTGDPLPLTSLLHDVPDDLAELTRTDAGAVVTGPPGRRVEDRRDYGLLLDSRYTFDAFVIGSSNRFAHAAALAVAEMPARSYNPLFIHGDAGLGKTHLLHAIGNYVRENFPSRRVRYVSTETFMNEFVDAIRSNTTIAFKRRYRECDVLLIDDVQFMEGKESLQEEFFHTFNHLYAASRQVVLTSDRAPKSIATLEDRLRSRFLSGLITDVQPPELETRLAILQKKLEREPASVPHEVLDFIATNVTDNIRELEGALIRVTAYGSLNHQPLTRELAEHVLSDLVKAGQPRPITPAQILDATAATFGFSIEDLCGPSRRRPLVIARQIGMYLFRELTDYSFPAIAREFGGRDHTTVMHAVEKISSLMGERRQIFDQVNDLILRIKSGA
ncbi:MAG TPA: chromosomal replication initiator protein DnaA [Acidimicrobiales bacterium]|nr:chromosomal replication initiator protein DnaA [Acidimicrobiales bacterium]